MYRVIEKFRDLTDRHLYETGDAFPFDGREIPGKRLEELSSSRNIAGRALISKVETSAPADVQRKEPETAKPRRTSRKTGK